MYLGKRVGVVVPAHNEEKHIRAVVETLPSLVDRAYVIDDCSTDGTWAEIRAAIRDAPAGRGVTVPTTENGRVERVNGHARESSSRTGDHRSGSHQSDDRVSRTDGGVTDGSTDERGSSTSESVTTVETASSDGSSANGTHSPVGGDDDHLTGGMTVHERSPSLSVDGIAAGETIDGGEDETGLGPQRRLLDAARSNGHALKQNGDRPVELPVNYSSDEQRPALVAVRHGTNRGRGGAVKRGYRLALEDGMDVVVVMDGDGQMDPDDLESIVHPVAVGRADYAKGNRLDGPEYWDGMSRFRLFGNLLLTGLTRVASGYWRVRDPQNGYTAISREALLAIPLDDLYDDYGFLNDMLVKLHMVDARVADVALPAIYGDEESGIRYSSFIPGLSILLFWNFLARLHSEGIVDGHYMLPIAYGLGGLGWIGALTVALLASTGVFGGSAVMLGGGLLLVGIGGLVLAVVLDGSRSLHLQQRVLPIEVSGEPN